jgi:hypothetical protein
MSSATMRRSNKETKESEEKERWRTYSIDI